jgi:hypothetical protein
MQTWAVARLPGPPALSNNAATPQSQTVDRNIARTLSGIVDLSSIGSGP